MTQTYTQFELENKMTNTMTKEAVYEAIAAKSTKITTVSFIKQDGSIRVINGLFKPSSKIVGSERGVAQGEAMSARGQVPVYELTSKQWKSFYADKVLEIK
jgi:hypothetical protein